MPRITTDTVYAEARVEPSVAFDARYCCIRIDGAANKRFRVAIGKRSEFYKLTFVGWHRLSWTYDFVNGPWKPFDNIANDGDYWSGTNNEAFSQDTIYVCNLPVYPLARLDKEMDEWIANPLTRPTPSGDDNYIIGNLPAFTGPHNKALPSVDLRAVAIGTGPKKVALMLGVHPDELSLWMLPGAMEMLLGESATSQALRDQYTFYVYPYMNPQGLYGGYTRLDPESATDANRFWDNSQTALRTEYRRLWERDLDGLHALFDFHSAPYGEPHENPRELRFNPTDNEAVKAAYLAALSTRTTFADVTSSVSGSLRHYVSSTFGADISITVEHTHNISENEPEWAALGANLMAALADI